MLLAFGIMSVSCGPPGASRGSAPTATSPSSEAKGNVGNFSLKDVDGKPHTLSDYLGKQVVVLTYFATWCEPCKMELTDLNSYYRTIADQPVTILAIAIDEPETQGDVRQFAKQRRYGFPVLLDTEQEAAALFNPKREAPFMVVIDKVPSIYWTHAGYLPGDDARIRSVIHAAVVQRLEAPHE